MFWNSKYEKHKNGNDVDHMHDLHTQTDMYIDILTDKASIVIYRDKYWWTD